MDNTPTTAQVPAQGGTSTSTGFISVLIVNWNTREHLRRCLEGLSGNAIGGPGEVIVVDNDSADGSADMVAEHFPDVILVRNKENVGFAGGVNEAASHAKGDLVLLLNSDTILQPDTIPLCREHLLSQDDIAVVGCRLVFPDGRHQNSTFRFHGLRGVILNALWIAQAFPDNWYLNWDRYGRKIWEEPQDVDVTMGSFMLIRRSAIGEGPPLDSRYFMYAEESDMCCRLKSEGWRVVHYPHAELTHVHGASTKTPKLEGWAAEAKVRGILRFIWTWRGTAVAWVANNIMLLGMVPRVAGWALADLLVGLKARDLKFRRLHKACVISFHLSVLLSPKTLQAPWAGPDRD